MRLCVVSEEISIKLNKLCPSKFQSKGLQDKKFVYLAYEGLFHYHSLIHSQLYLAESLIDSIFLSTFLKY